MRPRSGGGGEPARDTSDWQVILDVPNQRPVLRFDETAQALTELIVSSAPRFAVGVFGPWGSGKTTLLEAIARQLETPVHRSRFVVVRFDAWRYEREPHLIVPLIDTIRAGLSDWAHGPNRETSVATRARVTAQAFGSLAESLARALTVQAHGPAGSSKLSIRDVLGTLPATGQRRRLEAEDEPRSVYLGVFYTLRELIRVFIDDPSAPVSAPRRRIVVIVDDLDRCLPRHALEVLEAVKLLFDFDGVVFVVGLDPQLIQQAVQTALTGHVPPSASMDPTRYLSKIFQLTFNLPQISNDGIRELVGSMLKGLPPGQRDDIAANVVPHLSFLSDGRVNPRDVVRFINDYTLTEKITGCDEVDALLGVMTVRSVPAWRQLRSVLLFDPARFQAIASDAARDRGQAARDHHLEIPSSFAEYVRSAGRPLIETRRLAEILQVVEVAGGPRRVGGLARVREVLADLQAHVREATGDRSDHVQERLRKGVSELAGVLVDELLPSDFTSVASLLSDLNDVVRRMAASGPDDLRTDWALEAEFLLTSIASRVIPRGAS
jgi:KAP family P-loop domain